MQADENKPMMLRPVSIRFHERFHVYLRGCHISKMQETRREKKFVS
jgi:hypothetical protein